MHYFVTLSKVHSKIKYSASLDRVRDYVYGTIAKTSSTKIYSQIVTVHSIIRGYSQSHTQGYPFSDVQQHYNVIFS
jgi:hypothetical protein